MAALVWDRLGDPDSYVEPFYGSGAVHLLRPAWQRPRVETINDLDCYVVNFWRAVQAAPAEVAKHASWPVSELDMHARHRFLVGLERPEPEVPEKFASDPLAREAYLAAHKVGQPSYAAAFRERLRNDPAHHDARLAGWWCWGLCCWIGAGWCAEGAGWEQMPKLTSSPAGGDGKKGARSEKVPKLASHEGRGGDGVNNEKQAALHTGGRPQLADAFARGRGVNGNDSAETCADRLAWITDWFARLADRLRPVRVCCGHWQRICGSRSTMTRLGTVGAFLDPPYPEHKKTAGKKERSRADRLYGSDGAQDLDKLQKEILAWCRKWGPHPAVRVAVCGYDSDGYHVLEAEGWECVAWQANGGYANQGREKRTKNRRRERLWFSPHCRRQKTLFDDVPALNLEEAVGPLEGTAP